MRRQITLLTNFPEDVKLESESNHENINVKKMNSYLELQNSFEVVFNQKDAVIDSLRRRVVELHDQILGAWSPDTELSKFRSVEKGNEISNLPDEQMKHLAVEKATSTEATENNEFQKQHEKLKKSMQLLESRGKCLDETIEELKEKANECNDLIEENNDLKEEIIDLKESLQENQRSNDNNLQCDLKEQIHSLLLSNEKYEKEIQDSNEKISSLQNSNLSHESQLREKVYLLSNKDDDLTQLIGDIEEISTKLKRAHSAIDETSLVKEELVKSNFTIQVNMLLFFMCFMLYFSNRCRCIVMCVLVLM